MTTGAGHLFDAMAASYDDLEPWYEHLYAVLHGLVRAELGAPPGRAAPRALDAGCGSGFQTAILVELGYRTLGVDLSAGLLRTARARHAGADFVQGDLGRLPCRDGSLDLVVSCGSTLSFVEEPAGALRELARVLAPGGRLFLEAERRWSADLLWRLASSLSGDPLGYGATPGEAARAFRPPFAEGIRVDYPGYPGLTLFTRRELARWLEDAGLIPLQWWGLHSITNLIPSTVLHRDRLPRPLASLYAALSGIDRRLAATRAGCAAANSLVVLARKRAAAGMPEPPTRTG